MIFTVIYVGFVYPIAGSWKWGGGFLDELGLRFTNCKPFSSVFPINETNSGRGVLKCPRKPALQLLLIL